MKSVSLRFVLITMCVVLPVTVGTLAMSGCDSEDLAAATTNLTSKAKNLASDAVSAVAPNGSATINVDREYSLDPCFLRMLTIDGPRGSVLQVTNYKEEPDLASDCFLLQVVVPTETLEGSKGQALAGRFFPIQARGSLVFAAI